MSPRFRVPADEIESRCRRIQERLGKKGIDALLVVQRVDLFYFSGTSQSGWLFIPASGEPVLFIIAGKRLHHSPRISATRGAVIYGAI